MLTVRHLIESFVASERVLVRNGLRAAATLQWYVDNLKPLAPYHDFPAAELKAHHLTTVDFTNAFVRAVKRVYRWGAEEDIIPKDNFSKLTIPPCGQRKRVLERSEVVRLYRSGPRAFRLILFVQLRTLARPGELRTLTWSQVDWSQRVLWLFKFKSKDRRKDKLQARAIPLDLVVLRLLRNLHRKAADKSPGGFVFISTRGKRPWSSNGLRCAMRRARERCGLDGGDEPVVCYHMRHTGATEACRLDVDLKKLAEVMGHTRTSTTERYVHLSTADLVKTIDVMSARRRAGREK